MRKVQETLWETGLLPDTTHEGSRRAQAGSGVGLLSRGAV